MGYHMLCQALLSIKEPNVVQAALVSEERDSFEPVTQCTIASQLLTAQSKGVGTIT